jgi:hypothetical protein
MDGIGAWACAKLVEIKVAGTIESGLIERRAATRKHCPTVAPRTGAKPAPLCTKRSTPDPITRNLAQTFTMNWRWDLQRERLVAPVSRSPHEMSR